MSRSALTDVIPGGSLVVRSVRGGALEQLLARGIPLSLKTVRSSPALRY